MSSLSRVVKFGTIFTRIRDLMRAGVMKEVDRPLWYDTMKAFPPIEPPTLEREIPSEPIREILYPEDTIRAKFYKVYGTFYTVDLTSHSAVSKSPCHRFITKYQELEKTWTGSAEDLFEATGDALSQEGLQLRKRGEKRPSKGEKVEEEDTKILVSKEDLTDLLKTTVGKENQEER